MAGSDYPTLSYTATSTIPTTFTTSAANLTTVPLQYYNTQLGQLSTGLAGALSGLGLGSPTPIITPTKEPFMGTRLIRWTVVDPDHVLASKKPEAGVLLQGMTCLNGTDDKGLLMELSPKIAEILDKHNALRSTVEYDDEEGRTKILKPVRLGQLDVILEELKRYPA